MMGLHEYDNRPETKEEAYAELHLEDVLEAVRFIKFGITPGNGKKEAIDYVNHWKAWTKEHDQESYERIVTLESFTETTP